MDRLIGFGVAATGAAFLFMGRSVTAAGRARSRGQFALALAIAKAEGFGVPGSVPTVRHNPGDLKLNGNAITTFDTDADGWEALHRQIDRIRDGRSDYYAVGMTIPEMARVWTATEQSDWARNVIQGLREQGVTVNQATTLADLLL
jgi:hypothetical protein